MISRSILAATLAIGTAGAALADVKVNTPNVQVDTPAGGVNLNVDVGSKMKPSDAWIGRAVYSSDGKKLGEVAGIANDEIYADVGGFLGLGATRVALSTDQIAAAKDDRIDIKLTEAEAKALPPVDKKQMAPK